ncbi:MAG: hypothetical protein ABI461_19730 [Polyangiaceae bacterium]
MENANGIFIALGIVIMPPAPLPLRPRFAQVRTPLTPAARRIYEMLSCFETGDYLGALAASDEVLGAQAVVFRGSSSRAIAPPLSARGAYVLSLVEEQETVEELVYATGLPMLDALRCVCELVEIGLIRIEIAADAMPSSFRVSA